jgi:hypothetical protein
MKRFNKQQIEAAAWTFLQTFLGILAVSTFTSPEELANVVWAAAIASLLSLVKSRAVMNIGTPGTVFVTTDEMECEDAY